MSINSPEPSGQVGRDPDTEAADASRPAGRQTPWSKETEYRIERSETPVDVDGYKLGEPKRLVCGGCGAAVLLTETPSPGVDELLHAPACPQRFARSEWFCEQLR